MSRPKLVVTGAYGNVGRAVLSAADGYDLVVADLPEARLTGGVAVEGQVAEVLGDLTDPRVAAEAVAGADYVVHLAADPSPRASWDEAVSRNTAAAVNVVRAATGGSARSVVVASSVHAAGNSPTRVEPPTQWQPDPCCPYGLGKVLVEAHARFASAERKVPVTCLRLGWVTPRPSAHEALGIWVSPQDAAALVHSALRRARGFGIYFGISANSTSPWPNHAATALGYQPHDSSDSYRGDGLPTLSGEQSCPQVFRMKERVPRHR